MDIEIEPEGKKKHQKKERKKEARRRSVEAVCFCIRISTKLSRFESIFFSAETKKTKTFLLFYSLYYFFRLLSIIQLLH